MGVIVPNSFTEELAVVPTRPDGSYFRYEMICENATKRVYADTLAELLDRLIPGYLRMDSQQRLTSRVQHATDVQVRLQAQVNALYDSTPLTDEEWALLNGPRHEQPQLDIWYPNFPLVLVDAFYAPYSQTPMPVSGFSNVQNAENLWWLKPAAGEFEYVQSLHDHTVIELHILKDEAI